MSARAKAPASRKRPKQVDVSSEIRRAARRAGIRPKVALEDLKTALSEIASEKEAKRVADELKAATAAGTAALPDPLPQVGRLVLTEEFRNALSDLLSGGLWTGCDDGDGCGGPHAALLHLVGIQVKTLAIAYAHRESSLTGDFARGDWCVDENELSPAEVVTALHGLHTFIACARTALDTMITHGEFRDSGARFDAKAGAK